MEEAIIVSRLCRWAKWKLGSGSHLGFKSQISFVRLVGSCCEGHVIDVDSECIETNDAVKRLPELHKAVIRIEYLSECKNGAERAARLGVSRKSFILYRSVAYKYIGDYLMESQKKCLLIGNSFVNI